MRITNTHYPKTTMRTFSLDAGKVCITTDDGDKWSVSAGPQGVGVTLTRVEGSMVMRPGCSNVVHFEKDART